MINGNTSDGYKSRARHLKFFLDQEKYFIALEQMDCNSRLRDEQQRAIMQAITIHNSNSATGSNPPSDCICNAGFYEEFAGSRNACEAGKYKSAGGQQACANCVAGNTLMQLVPHKMCVHRVRRILCRQWAVVPYMAALVIQGLVRKRGMFAVPATLASLKICSGQ